MSNLLQFKKAIIKDKSACYNLLNGQLSPTDGFMVNIEGHDVLLVNEWEQGLQYHLAGYIKDKAYILIGGTTNQRYFIDAVVTVDGHLLLNIAVKVTTKDEAIMRAMDNNQKYYTDNGKNTLVWL